MIPLVPGHVHCDRLVLKGKGAKSNPFRPTLPVRLNYVTINRNVLGAVLLPPLGFRYVDSAVAGSDSSLRIRDLSFASGT